MSKKSIRFFNDREVRAVWDDANNKWWFSATDIVRAINDEDDYVKAGNYWRWLKKKINTEGIQLVSVTHDFKFQAPDGKQRAADALDADCLYTIGSVLPMHSMPIVYRRSPRTIRTTVPESFLTGSSIVIIALTGRVRKRPTHSLKADCWIVWNLER